MEGNLRCCLLRLVLVNSIEKWHMSFCRRGIAAAGLLQFSLRALSGLLAGANNGSISAFHRFLHSFRRSTCFERLFAMTNRRMAQKTFLAEQLSVLPMRRKITY